MTHALQVRFSSVCELGGSSKLAEGAEDVFTKYLVYEENKAALMKNFTRERVDNKNDKMVTR